MNYLNQIQDFKENKIKIENKVAIVGRGRWAQVILKEIQKNFPNIKKIYVYSSFFRKNKISLNKKVAYVNSIRSIKNNYIKHIIFASRSRNNFYLLKKFLGDKTFLLCEKPLLTDIVGIKNLLTFSRKNLNNIAVSMQYFYAFYFYYINKNFINKKSIQKILFEWFDKKKEKRYGQIKRQDYNINQIEDVFYHFYSILKSSTKIDNFQIKGKVKNLKNISSLKLDGDKKIFIEIICSRKAKFRKRLLTIFLKNKRKLSINFSNDNKVIFKINKKKMKIPLILMSKTLKYQLFFFLKQNKLHKKGELNNIKNLINFFKYANLIKKNL